MHTRDKRSTAEALGNLLSLREPPTAVFAEQDEVAVAVLCTLRRTRIPVPERMSVLGFDISRWRTGSSCRRWPSRRLTSGARPGNWPCR
ncbi:substrate-binding domain-containing protein [Streptomyces thermocarboxydovorans]|uniref:substrate-binding domain-containing protein n=1 Tax=Streptomyces thermocarboxydovorans TaxID=59298 RepID=UPI0031E3594F